MKATRNDKKRRQPQGEPGIATHQCDLISFIVERADMGQSADLVEPLKLLAKTITDDESGLDQGFDSEEWGLFCALVIGEHDATLIELTMDVLVKLFTAFPRHPFAWLFDPVLIETMHRELAGITSLSTKAAVVRVLAKMSSISPDVARQGMKLSACVLREMEATQDDGLWFYGLRYLLSLIEVEVDPPVGVLETIVAAASSRNRSMRVRLLALECIFHANSAVDVEIDPESDEPEITAVKLRILEKRLDGMEAPQFGPLLWKLVLKSRGLLMKQSLACLIKLFAGPSREKMAATREQIEHLVCVLGSGGFDVDLHLVQLIQVAIESLSDSEIVELDLPKVASHVCSLLSSQMYEAPFEEVCLALLGRVVHAVEASGCQEKREELLSDHVTSSLDASHPQYQRVMDTLRGTKEVGDTK